MSSEAQPPPTGAAVIGVDIGGTKIDVALADLEGNLVERARIATNAAAGPTQAFDRLAAVVDRLRHQAATAHGLHVQGIAGVCPGVLQTDAILFAPNLPGWERTALARELATIAGLAHADVLNDVKGAGLAEARFGALRDVDPGLYVNVGTGLAAALVVGGRVVDGAHHGAGEIAYTITRASLAAEDPQAELESQISGQGLGQRWAEVSGGQPSSADLFASTSSEAQTVIDEAIGALAVAMVNLCALIDPQRIVLGGGVMASAERFLPPLAAHLRRLVPFPPEVAPALFTQDASLRGAVALALGSLPSAAPSGALRGAPSPTGTTSSASTTSPTRPSSTTAAVGALT